AVCAFSPRAVCAFSPRAVCGFSPRPSCIQSACAAYTGAADIRAANVNASTLVRFMTSPPVSLIAMRPAPRRFRGLRHRSAADLAQPALEESSLRLVGDERESARIARGRVPEVSQATQQVGSRRVKQVIAVEVLGERLDQ